MKGCTPPPPKGQHCTTNFTSMSPTLPTPPLTYQTSPPARGQPPEPPRAPHSFQRANVDGPLDKSFWTRAKSIGKYLASRLRMAIPALNSSVISRGLLCSFWTISYFSIIRLTGCCTHPKRANLGKWMERAMMSSKMLNKFTTKHSNTASSLWWFITCRSRRLER